MDGDPSIGEALLGFLLIGGAGVVIPAAVVLPAIGLAVWLTHRWRRWRNRPEA